MGPGGPRQARVVQVHQLPKSYTVRQLTDEMNEGPLIRVEMKDDHRSSTESTVIILIKAEDAKSFFFKNVVMRAEVGESQSCYGPGLSVGSDKPYPDPGVLQPHGDEKSWNMS